VHLIPDPDGGSLALTPQQRLEARRWAQELLGGADVGAPGREADPNRPRGQDAASERLLSAESLAALTDTAASWWESAASRGAVAHYKIGRYRRFKYSEVLGASVLRGKARVIGEPLITPTPELPVARRFKVKT
jgi:hypothetical protein